MLLVELHSHTKYSRGTKVLYDGVNTPREMVEHAKKIGLDAIAITDHDNIKGAYEAKKYEKKYGIKVIIGEEVSSRNGHILAIDIQEQIKPHSGVEEIVDEIREQGGIAIASHPFDIKRAGLREMARYCDAIEVFNAQNLDKISNRIAIRFAKKCNMPITAGSDAHSTTMIGHGLVTVKDDNIIKAIKKRRLGLQTTYPKLSIVTDLAIRRLKLSYDYVLNYIDENYFWPKRYLAKKLLSLVEKSPGRIDYLLRVFTYIAFGSVVTYSGARGLWDYTMKT